MFEKLSDIFIAAAEKYLTAVDANPGKSNQHEIGGLKKAGIADLIGYPENGGKYHIPVTMVYIDSDGHEPIICEDRMSWYDTRFNQAHRSPEFRLYYRSNEVTEQMREGDFFLIALTQDNSLLVVITPPNSDTEKQLRVIFGALSVNSDNKLRKIPVDESSLIAPVRLMLAELGIEFYAKSDADGELLSRMLSEFGVIFPKTKIFSDFSRAILKERYSAIEQPDDALLAWMDYEERLFRILERHIVSERLKAGFGKSGHDVDEFIQFSLSVQNRRKSRVGHAFENHITEILIQNKVRFEKGVYTEGKQKPDFLFPGRTAYLDPHFNQNKLFMLAAKTTCKERWRQVLAEAEKIRVKHLITLEPSISEDQTKQMRAHMVQLVVPKPIQETFTVQQKADLVSLLEFINNIKEF